MDLLVSPITPPSLSAQYRAASILRSHGFIDEANAISPLVLEPATVQVGCQVLRGNYDVPEFLLHAAIEAIFAELTKGLEEQQEAKQEAEQEQKQEQQEELAEEAIEDKEQVLDDYCKPEFVGRKVRLRNGYVAKIRAIDPLPSDDEETIVLNDGTWLFSNGRFSSEPCDDHDFDIMSILPKEPS